MTARTRELALKLATVLLALALAWTVAGLAGCASPGSPPARWDTFERWQQLRWDPARGWVRFTVTIESKEADHDE